MRVRCTVWPALGHAALQRLQTNLANLDRRVFGAGRRANPPHRRANARNQFARAEGLGHVIVRARFQRLHLVLFLVAHRQHQDRQPRRKAANAAQRLNAANARHIHIQQHRIVGPAAQQLQRLFAARGLRHLKSEFNQRRAQCPANG